VQYTLLYVAGCTQGVLLKSINFDVLNSHSNYSVIVSALAAPVERLITATTTAKQRSDMHPLSPVGIVDVAKYGLSLVAINGCTLSQMGPSPVTATTNCRDDVQPAHACLHASQLAFSQALAVAPPVHR
jgi:hypothetical protein